MVVYSSGVNMLRGDFTRKDWDFMIFMSLNLVIRMFQHRSDEGLTTLAAPSQKGGLILIREVPEVLNNAI